MSALRRRDRSTAAAVIAVALIGCGRTDIDQQASLDGPGELDLVATSDELLDGRDYDWAQLVARSQGWDLIAGLSEAHGGGVMARRLAASSVEPEILLGEGLVSLAPGPIRSARAASTADGTLALCHVDPDDGSARFSAFLGAYAPVVAGLRWGGSTSRCEGLAFGPSGGVVALGWWDESSCCSRSWIAPVTSDGHLGELEPALAGDELGEVSLARYFGGFAWAGRVKGDRIELVMAPDGGARERIELIAGMAADRRPAIAGWPFSPTAVALSWRSTSGARLSVVEQNGRVVIDRPLKTPAGATPSRASLSAAAAALLVAHAACDGDEGEIVVELVGPDGEASGGVVRVPTACPAEVNTIASSGRRALVSWSAGGEHAALVAW